MFEFINGKAKEFFAGSIVGLIAGIKFLFAGPMDWGSLVIQYSLKFVAVCLFAFMSGLFTVMAKDFYDLKLKNWMFKKKKNEEDKD